MRLHNSKKKKLIFCIVAIVLAGLAVYGNSLNGQFVWDDKQLIQDNPTIKDGAKAIGYIFAHSLRASSDGSTTSFRPLQAFFYMMDYSVWRLNAFGYHLTNVIFHILAALAVFWLGQLLFGDVLLSFWMAFLFVLHPVHTEAVAYISGLADPMVAFFMCLSFCLYLKGDSALFHRNRALSPYYAYYVLMCLSYLCALLSRENGLIFPALVLLYHYSFKKPVSKNLFIGVVVTSIIYIVWRGIVFKGTISDMPVQTTLWQRTPGMFVALANYIRLLLVPFNLHMEYGGLLFYWNEPKIYVGMALFIGGLIWIYRNRRDSLKFFAMGWFLVALIPLSNIYALNAYMAEHWLYMPSIGFFLLAAHGIVSLYRKQEHRIYAVIVCAGLTVYYGGMTIYQNSFWRDPVRFYKRMLEFNPESARLYTNLVSEYMKAGKEGDYLELLEKAIEIDPTQEVIYNNLGIAYNKMGMPEKAVETYQKAIALRPEYGLAYYNAGIIYADVLHDLDKAVEFLQQGVKRDSSLYQGYHKLGLIYLTRNRRDEALAMLKKAVEINPDAWEVYRSLGYCFMLQGDVQRAIENYKKAFELNPGYTEVCGDLAIAYYSQGQFSMAVEYYDKAVAIGYQNPQLMKALQPYR
ncbi:MAG: tetratricopeptide repeat protein [Candidatus Omnitrophica bacterium]|nr:tetratricopeptide repeat protein [Candidatus Omnitrophota bacterium]